MQTRKIGRLDVSLVGLGTNNFGRRCDQAQTSAVIDVALDSGINLLDTADIYGPKGLSEEFIGKALKGKRDRVVLATKFGFQIDEDPTHKGGSARWISEAIEGSLRRLKTDRVDLYQMHFPDQEVAIEETLTALDRLVQDGKVLEIGCSNYSGAQIDEAMAASQSNDLTRFVSAQNHYNLLERSPEAEVIPACERHGLGILPYFPLANGMLTGKYRRGQDPPEGTRMSRMSGEQRDWVLSDRHFDIIEKLGAFAAERGHTLLDLAFSWLSSQSTVVSVIAGATKPDQVKANAGAASWELSKEELAEVDSITKT